jgi:hypothetical protein
LLIKFSLKQNMSTCILNLRLRGNIHLTLTFHVWLLMKFGINIL